MGEEDIRKSSPDTFAAALVQESPDALLALSPDGTVLFWNRGAETLFGYTRQEAVGRRLDRLVIPEDRRQEVLRAMEEALAGKTVRFETVRHRKDGTQLDVHVSKRAVKDPNGQVLFIAANEKDVTQLRRLREERAAEARFRGLLEAAPDAMVIVDTSGRISLVNSRTEEVFGYRREELLGQSIEVLIPARFRETHPHKRHGYFAEPRTRPMGAGLDLFALCKDGREFPAEISLAPLETEGGLLVTAAIRDISLRKQLEERMQQANRLKSEFLANMSHELRTPLNAIIGFAQLMHDHLVDPASPQQDEFVGHILNSGHHLLQLVNDILDLSKVEAGKMEFRPEPTDLARVVDEVVALLRTAAAAKKIGVERIVAPLPPVLLDPGRFKQVLYNYLSNALKFTPEAGRVTVRVTAEAAAVRLEVEDTGVGIKREDLGRLFAEFQQLDDALTKKQGGTGLGLALTKRIVEAQGGSVGVHSVVGTGSVFYAVLPLRTRAEDVPTPENAFAETGSPTVLIIEDDDGDATLLATTLIDAGYRVQRVRTGHEAITAFDGHHFDAVTLDLLLPDTSGLEVLGHIRRSSGNADVPVICITIVAETSTMAGLPVHEVMEKPISGVTLLASLDRLGIRAGVGDPLPRRGAVEEGA
jgi:PAS domain S-box-containing protein